MAPWLQISCDFCKSFLEIPGGLLFIPIPDDTNFSKKNHVCVECSARVWGILDLTATPENRDWGVYYAPPLAKDNWVVFTRYLSWDELSLLQKTLTCPW